MNAVIKWCTVFVMMLPMLATADPVRVQATASGTMGADAVWVGIFSGYKSTWQGGPVPFNFTLSAELDPDSPGFSTYTLGEIQNLTRQINPRAVATLEFNGESYTIDDGRLLVVGWSQDYFSVNLSFERGSYDLDLSLSFHNRGTNFTGNPLSPRELATAGTVSASFSSDASPMNPDAGGNWMSWGPASATMTLSPVPEPSSAFMLLGGLAVLLSAFGRSRRS